MLVSFVDALEICDAQPTADGYLALSGAVARSGVYQYLASELGLEDAATVGVLRPEASVFDAASLRSYTHKPVTNLHPDVSVTPKNWADLAKGYSGDEVIRDGQRVRVPMMLTDAGLIADYHAGKVELSPGYTAEITPQTGIHDGQPYQFVMGPPTINHIAVVPKGRGGVTCRLGDAWPIHDSNPTPAPGATKMPKIILVDGLQVEVGDAAEAAIIKLQGVITTRDAALVDANTQLGALTATISTKDGEIAALKSQLADAAITPAKLDDAVRARTLVVDAAKPLLPADFNVAALTDAEIRKAAVKHKLGDAVVATLDDNGITGAFTALTAAAPGNGGQIRDAILGGGGQTIADAEARSAAARQKMIDEMTKPKAAA